MSAERFTGRVKWFNNKSGFGFITITDGVKSGTDVFVHHSSIKVDSEQYRYLVQGEYVEFSLTDTQTGEHEYQAGEVSGIKGGKLMCEKRNDSRVARSQYREKKPSEQYVSEDKPVVHELRRQNARQQKPRSVPVPQPLQENAEWKQVEPKRNANKKTQSSNEKKPSERKRTVKQKEA